MRYKQYTCCAVSVKVAPTLLDSLPRTSLVQKQVDPNTARHICYLLTEGLPHS